MAYTNTKIVELKIHKERFNVFMPYDYETVQIIQQIEKRFWDTKYKTWNLPLSEYGQFYEYLHGRGFKIVQLKDEVLLYHIGDDIEFKLTTWMQDRKALLAITGINYFKDTRMYTVPKANLEELLLFFADKKITFINRCV